MWAIRVSHPGLNKYRIIKGGTQYDAEQKAAVQIKAWNAQWQRIQQTQERRKQREQKAWGKEERKHLADLQTIEAEHAIAALDSLLHHAATRDNRIDWSKLKDSSIYAEPKPQKPPLPVPPAQRETPAQPRIESFLPHLSWFVKLIPPIRNKRNAEARASFNASFATWRKSKIEIERANSAEVEQRQQMYASDFKQHGSDLTEWHKRKITWLLDQRNRNAAIDEKQAAYIGEGARACVRLL